MNKLFLELVNMSLTAGILIVVVALARHLLRKAPKNVNYILWAMVAVRLVCPFTIESSFSLVPSQIGKVSTRQVESSFFGKLGITTNHFMVLWIAGTLIMLGYSTLQYARLYARMCTAIRLRDDVWQSEYVITPFVFGIRNPRIYVPYTISDEQLQMVVAHEHAHLRQGDHIIKLIAFVILSVYWFNPLVWVAYILLCRDIEVACDERVVKHMSRRERKIYSEALLSLSVSGKSIAACPVCFGEVGVKMRIKKILSYENSSLFRRAEAAIACFLVAICFLSNPEATVVKNKLLPLPLPGKWEAAKETLKKQESNASESTGDHKLAEEKDTSTQEVVHEPEPEAVASKAKPEPEKTKKPSGQDRSENKRVNDSEEDSNTSKPDQEQDDVKENHPENVPEETPENTVEEYTPSEEDLAEEEGDVSLVGKQDESDEESLGDLTEGEEPTVQEINVEDSTEETPEVVEDTTDMVEETTEEMTEETVAPEEVAPEGSEESL